MNHVLRAISIFERALVSGCLCVVVWFRRPLSEGTSSVEIRPPSAHATLPLCLTGLGVCPVLVCMSRALIPSSSPSATICWRRCSSRPSTSMVRRLLSLHDPVFRLAWVMPRTCRSRVLRALASSSSVAVQYCTRLVYLHDVISGSFHRETLSAILKTATLLQEVNAYPLAIALYKTVLKRASRALTITLTCLSGLSQCHAGLGAYREAIELERRCFELSR